MLWTLVYFLSWTSWFLILARYQEQGENGSRFLLEIKNRGKIDLDSCSKSRIWGEMILNLARVQIFSFTILDSRPDLWKPISLFSVVHSNEFSLILRSSVQGRVFEGIKLYISRTLGQAKSSSATLTWASPTTPPLPSYTYCF